MKTTMERITHTPEQAADVLGVSRGLLYKLIKNGSVPSVKMGRRRLIPVEALNKMLLATAAAAVPQRRPKQRSAA